MILTKEQQAILDGEKGEVLAKVMKTLVMYGDAFEAEKLVPVTSKYNHLVTSFGLKVMSPVYDLMQQILDAGVCSEQKFSVDPRPIDSARLCPGENISLFRLISYLVHIASTGEGVVVH